MTRRVIKWESGDTYLSVNTSLIVFGEFIRTGITERPNRCPCVRGSCRLCVPINLLLTISHLRIVTTVSPSLQGVDAYLRGVKRIYSWIQWAILPTVGCGIPLICTYDFRQDFDLFLKSISYVYSLSVVLYPCQLRVSISQYGLK